MELSRGEDEIDACIRLYEQESAVKENGESKNVKLSS